MEAARGHPVGGDRVTTLAAVARPDRPTALEPPAPVPWPRVVVVASLTTLALLLAVLEIVRPSWAAHVGPAVLAGATLAMGALVLRHSRGLDSVARPTWRGFAVIAVL